MKRVFPGTQSKDFFIRHLFHWSQWFRSGQGHDDSLLHVHCVKLPSKLHPQYRPQLIRLLLTISHWHWLLVLVMVCVHGCGNLGVFCQTSPCWELSKRNQEVPKFPRPTSPSEGIIQWTTHSLGYNLFWCLCKLHWYHHWEPKSVHLWPHRNSKNWYEGCTKPIWYSKY